MADTLAKRDGHIMSDEEYRDLPYYSQSDIKAYDKNPFEYHYYKEHTKEQTKPQQLGTAIHKAILEPKEFKKCEETLMKGLFIPTKRSFPYIVQSLANNTALIKMLNKSKFIERAFIFKQEVSDEKQTKSVFCKLKADLVTNDGIILDVKTTRNLTYRGIYYAMGDYRYDIQAAWYVDGLKHLGWDIKSFCMAFVQTSPPYESAVFEVSPAMIKRGRTGNQFFKGYKQILPELHFNPKKSMFGDISTIDVDLKEMNCKWN